MALASTSTVHHLLSSNNSSKLVLRPQATHQTTTAEPPQQRRRSSYAIKLSNLLHLKHVDTHDLKHVDTDTVGGHGPTYSPKEDISAIRPQIHGPGDWSPLLNPLHPSLRREIVKYGEFAQATYDAFDSNPVSPYCGSCMYGRRRLFEKLSLARHRYTPTKYLYAMSHVSLPRWLERSLHADTWSNDSNWMGYVAVSDDAESRRIGCRDIVVAWRGTIAPSEWLENLQSRLEPLWPHGDQAARVEHGFLSMYTSKSESTRYNRSSASEQVMEEVKRLVELYKGEEVSLTVTGHSLGGALAVLNAYEAAAEIPGLPVSVISFGAPRVGNEAFREELESLGVKTLRVVVKQDMVPRVPGILFNEGIIKRMVGALEWVYTHVGVELGLDVRASPYLKHGMDLPGFHSLETYLHLVDGYQSGGEGFRREAKRDVALVNKASRMLREELRVPACWNQAPNKGLVCDEFGRWVQPEREPDDIPSPYRQVPTATELKKLIMVGL